MTCSRLLTSAVVERQQARREGLRLEARGAEGDGLDRALIILSRQEAKATDEDREPLKLSHERVSRNIIFSHLKF
jgi:hypothetical protein